MCTQLKINIPMMILLNRIRREGEKKWKEMRKRRKRETKRKREKRTAG